MTLERRMKQGTALPVIRIEDSAGVASAVKLPEEASIVSQQCRVYKASP